LLILGRINKGGNEMASTVKRELILEGLGCAHCAAKIEEEVNRIDGVSATINFMTKTLTVETTDKYEFNDIIQKITSIVHNHEPDVKVIDKYQDEH